MNGGEPKVGRAISRSVAFGLVTGAAGAAATAVGAIVGLTSFSAIWPVLTICALVGAIAHDARRAMAEQIDNRTRTLRTLEEKIRRDLGDIHGLVRLGPYLQDLPLPFGGGWALTGDSAAVLARETLVRRPESVLELGSGASTLIVGQILKKSGRGRLLSVDHDPVWANQTRRYVKYLGLEDVVSVVDAPLKDVAVGDRTVEWYDIPAGSLDRLGPIDMLIVDGPPQFKDNPVQARYPALPVLRDRLAPDAVVFLDDANRATESGMVARWSADDAGWHAQWFDTVDGVCLLTRPAERPAVAEP